MREERLITTVITRFQRFWLEVDTPDGSRVELAFDKGVIVAGDKSEPIMEVELELLEGNSAVLLQIGAMLAKECGLRPESRSKYYRGLVLGGFATEAKDSGASLKPPDEPCGKAVKELVVAHLFRVWDLAKIFMDDPDDPLTVHQLRVGIRRLRSMLALAKPFLAQPDYERFISELAQLAGRLGRLREMDAALDVLQEDNATLRNLRKEEALQRQADFYRGIETPVLLELWAVLEESDWLDEDGRNIKSFAAARIEIWLQKLMNESREAVVGEVLENPLLHKLRVRAKRTRYVWEVLNHLWPQEKGAMRRGLIRLQDNLGTICDAGGADKLWQEALRGQSDPQVYYAAGRIAGWQEARAGAAGKEQPVNVAQCTQRLTGFAPALDEIKHTRRQPGLLPQFDHRLAAPGRQLARLEDHRVTRQQGGHDVAVRQVTGEVIGAEHRQHAVRTVAQRGGPVRHLGTLFAGAGVVRLD